MEPVPFLKLMVGASQATRVMEPVSDSLSMRLVATTSSMRVEPVSFSVLRVLQPEILLILREPVSSLTLR